MILLSRRKIMKYLIFSDESGNWNSGDYYIRAWIKVNESDHDALCKEILFINNILKVEELKWNGFKTNYKQLDSKGRLQGLVNLNYELFLTITDTSHFQNKKYNIYNALKGAQFFGDLPESIDENNLRKRLENTIKSEYFFSIYESQHIKNAKKALMRNSKADFDFIIDKPPYLGWKELAKACGIKAEVEDSKRCRGIQLADVICGCIKDFTKNNQEAGEIYRGCFKKHMINMYDKNMPNPNLVFIHDFKDREKRRLNIFR